jgi:hypothetical protein
MSSTNDTASAINSTALQKPEWLNSGDNAWQLTASSLVALQSIPGLVVIYAGLVKTKWAINSAFMVFYAFAAVMVCWGVWAYQMSFGEKMIPGIVGIPRPILSSLSEMKQVRQYKWGVISILTEVPGQYSRSKLEPSISYVHPGLFSICICSHYRDTLSRRPPRAYELQGLDAIRAALAYLLLHHRSVLN